MPRACSTLFLFRLVQCTTSGTLFAQSYVPEWNDKKIKVKSKAEVQAGAFNPADVKLPEGPFREDINNNMAGPVYGIRLVKGKISSLTFPVKNGSIYR